MIARSMFLGVVFFASTGAAQYHAPVYVAGGGTPRPPTTFYSGVTFIDAREVRQGVQLQSPGLIAEVGAEVPLGDRFMFSLALRYTWTSYYNWDVDIEGGTAVAGITIRF